MLWVLSLYDSDHHKTRMMIRQCWLKCKLNSQDRTHNRSITFDFMEARLYICRSISLGCFPTRVYNLSEKQIMHQCCWKLFIRSTIYHLTNYYLLQWAICCSSGLPFSVFFSGLTPEKLVRSPTCDWSWPNKSVPIKMSSRVVCSRGWGVG